ncbi:hypothetical protein [Agathobaculum desmolans]|uniref:hypothetical protein n=1 Tax=Agathobaculum desmolans TaxID=39484 RepID=UPI00248E7774|nr:hypothetical protein [Agathobaculum desmolans]
MESHSVETEAPVLNYFNCIRLLDTCVKVGLIKRDPDDQNAILVYRSAGTIFPEGWYSENLMCSARELLTDAKGQRILLDALEGHGVNFKPKKMYA